MDYRILKTKGNAFVEFRVFLNAVKDKDLVYIGEFHQMPELLSFQIAVVSELLHKGMRPALGLEMFNVLQQTMLDYYIAGAISLEQFSELYRAGPEGFDLNHYIYLIEVAAKNNLKAVGLNIPKSIASAVAKHGLDKRELECFRLSEEEIRNCNKDYKKSLSAIYKKHPHEDISEENFILAQSIKDETMAETIAHYLTAGIQRKDTKGNENPPSPPFNKGRPGGFLNKNIGKPFIIITGRGHVEYGRGIPGRIKKKLGASVSDVIIAASYADEHLPPEIADYLLIIE